jgi:hypothetical protein
MRILTISMLLLVRLSQTHAVLCSSGVREMNSGVDWISKVSKYIHDDSNRDRMQDAFAAGDAVDQACVLTA